MRLRHSVLLFLSFFLIPAPATRAQHQHEHPAGDPEKLGQVHFPTSCNPAVQKSFERAVAMLHSFWYDATASAFAAVAEKDPACGMAYWGVAMSYYHPLWEAPSPTDLKAGSEAVERAKAAGGKTERERDYIAAIETFYRDYERADHRTRTRAYEQAIERLYRRYPDDREAALFYALALLATAPPTDKTYAHQKKAGPIAEGVFAAQPDHPGAAHYIIHAYDNPVLASRALEAARRYLKIAPDSPHALHMPSHIFTRLGLWEESVASNLDSAAAARKHGLTGDELHAMDYLMYAYLQTAQDEKARQLLAVPSMKAASAARFAGFYALAAIPARWALERRAWPEAAALPVPEGVFPGGRQAWLEANLHFARAVGAARSGAREDARRAIARLAALREVLLGVGEKYWADQVEVQRMAAAGWLAHSEGSSEEAVRLLRAAADLEDAMEKHPVTPGPVLPAREMLGDLLLLLERHTEARAAFETVLAAAPRRFNALFGAARAAELSGNREAAAQFYRNLLGVCREASTDRPELRHARGFLEGERAASR